jgi:uncharacterized protein (TIGR03437 family)
MTGPTPGPEVPQSPGALSPVKQSTAFQQGVYLSGVDFSSSPAGPSIACVLDSANFSHTGVVAPLQLISILGSNLGPAVPAFAAAGEQSLGGVSIAFDGTPAKLLYVSASQLNVAVPQSDPRLARTSTVMQLSYNGGTAQRQFPLARPNPGLFADLSSSQSSCPSTQPGYQPLALNEDGSINGCGHPAAAGSKVSLFLNGAGEYGSTIDTLNGLVANLNFGCTFTIVGSSIALNDYVLQVDLRLPAASAGCGPPPNSAVAIPFTLSYQGTPVGPFVVPATSVGPSVTFALSSQSLPMLIWVKP